MNVRGASRRFGKHFCMAARRTMVRRASRLKKIIPTKPEACRALRHDAAAWPFIGAGIDVCFPCVLDAHAGGLIFLNIRSIEPHAECNAANNA